MGYSAINTARSALSSLIGKIDGCPIGEHKLIVDFMKGVGRLRPVRARYSVTWNPDKVLNYLRTIKLDECSLKQIALKLIALMALSTGQRV